ncbi:hypothetical protein [Natronococcus wangiae]|uniref:hypothetical protein n=1 Tax=Natronococcus wangiae TaxID=3068275 RepID=UPI00273E23DE|nr:hypothetical protein [Natronococcus sp. AD5]
MEPNSSDSIATDSDLTVRDGDSPSCPDERRATETKAADSSTPRLGSRVLVTWIELTAVGIIGGILGATVGGPPGFVIYLATTLITVGIIFHNVNELIKSWLQMERPDRPSE